ncbi:MAG TPA: site-2 protease family protein [Myxococcaceae bacterium]|nr:site-2 protease family protein [Myxococcaceae bacterium]
MSGFRIGTIKGIPIRVHYSFLLILPFLAYQFGLLFVSAARHADVPPQMIQGHPFLWGLGLALALFLSVLLHELGHSLYALRKGGRVQDITLLMIGGVSNITTPPKSPRQEAVMSLVGPLTSLILAVVFYALKLAAAEFNTFNLQFALFYLAEMNLFLGLFNLLPAFPMDGGRIVRAFLTERYGLLRATQIAVGLGKAFAVLFGIIGLFSFNIVLIIIAFFIFVGAEAESRGVLVKAMLGHVRVRDLMSPSRESVSPTTSVYDAAEQMLRDRRLAYPVLEDGRIVGLLAESAVERVPPHERKITPVGKVMRGVETVGPDDDLGRALQALSAHDVALLPVVQDGALIGILRRSDVMRGLKLQELEASQKQTSAYRPDRHIHVGA